MTTDFLDVTEIDGQLISQEQLNRICHRYHWAANACAGADVLEVACGAGQGLGLLAKSAKSIAAGDFSEEVLACAKRTFPQMALSRFGAESLPFAAASFDCIILFEALYYVNAEMFFREARRVLRPGGILLVTSANPDLYDFTPSPYTTRYLGARELAEELAAAGFAVELSGYVDVTRVSPRQRVLRPIKALASRWGLIPKTMSGKEMLKKLFFGQMAIMPSRLDGIAFDYTEPTPISVAEPDFRHKVIYCRATAYEKDSAE